MTTFEYVIMEDKGNGDDYYLLLRMDGRTILNTKNSTKKGKRFVKLRIIEKR
jgi:hypothetical protein